MAIHQVSDGQCVSHRDKPVDLGDLADLAEAPRFPVFFAGAASEVWARCVLRDRCWRVLGVLLQKSVGGYKTPDHDHFPGGFWVPCYRGLLASARVHKRQVIGRFERSIPLPAGGQSTTIEADKRSAHGAQQVLTNF